MNIQKSESEIYYHSYQNISWYNILGELIRIATLTKEYLSQRGVEAQVQTFQHPDAMLLAGDKERFYIYLLDMVMPMLSGIEAGRTIRRHFSTDA